MAGKAHTAEQILGKLRDELLKGEVFCTRGEAQVLVEQWRKYCHQVRPHSALGYRPPAPAARHIRPCAWFLRPRCTLTGRRRRPNSGGGGTPAEPVLE